MPRKHTLVVTSDKAPSVEFDPSCGAVYVRFTSNPVHKTLERESDDVVITVDMDKDGEVIGIEGIGFDEFSLHQLLQSAGVTADRIDFAKVKFRGTPRGVEPELAPN